MDIEASGEASRIEEAIDLALRLFLERGYDNTPMSLIAKELGLTKPGVYHYFESKEDLLYKVHKHAMDRQLSPVLDRMEKIADPLERLKVFMMDYAAIFTRDPTPGVLIHESKRLSPEHLSEIRAVSRRQYDLVRGAIVELQAQKRCRRDLNAAFVAFGALGLVSWIHQWFDYSRPESAEEVARTMLDLFLGGILGAPRDSAHLK